MKGLTYLINESDDAIIEYPESAGRRKPVKKSALSICFMRSWFLY
jgi:hypothetical protein